MHKRLVLVFLHRGDTVIADDPEETAMASQAWLKKLESLITLLHDAAPDGLGDVFYILGCPSDSLLDVMANLNSSLGKSITNRYEVMKGFNEWPQKIGQTNNMDTVVGIFHTHTTHADILDYYERNAAAWGFDPERFNIRGDDFNKLIAMVIDFDERRVLRFSQEAEKVSATH